MLPPGLVKEMARGIQDEMMAQQARDRGPTLAADWDAPDDDERPGYDGMDDDDDGDRTDNHQHVELPKHLQSEVRRLHINLGHPSLPDFIRALRAGRARPDIIDWTRRHFTCEQCSAQRSPHSRRKATLPRTFRFNKIVAVDLFFLEALVSSFAILNMIDHGTSYQVCEIVGPSGSHTAARTWQAFERTWLRYFGPPRS